ncbi:MAG TPA: YceI family protein [Anaerolineae bacterium]|nr:YceI family protein [Anaerolineae bacterium]HNU03184.1 YceI family protein [Anaerolineae bacterium]
MIWKTDASHTTVNFVARHMMLSKVRGEFQDFDIDFNLDTAHPEQATVEARIQTASIFTKDEKRDAHLRSADFFDAESYPEMVFKSSRIERTGNESAKLHGDLTIRGVTKPVTLDVSYLGSSKSPWGATSIGFEASTKINREDWGLTWNVALETGGWLVAKEITISIETEFVQQPESVQEPLAADAVRSGATAAVKGERTQVGVN